MLHVSNKQYVSMNQLKLFQERQLFDAHNLIFLAQHLSFSICTIVEVHSVRNNQPQTKEAGKPNNSVETSGVSIGN